MTEIVKLLEELAEKTGHEIKLVEISNEGFEKDIRIILKEIPKSEKETI